MTYPHEFNVGDIVQRIGTGQPGVDVGAIGTITEVYEYGHINHDENFIFVHVEWENPEYKTSRDATNYLALIKPAPTKSIEPEIKVHTYTKSSNPKDRAATNRLDLSLFPQSAIVYGALGMTEGDCKYGGYNSRVEGVAVSTYVAALLRHLFDFYNGEWAYPQSKVPHLASVLANSAIIVDGFVQGNIIDDRPPKQDVSKLLIEFQSIVEHLHKTFPNGPERFTEVKNGN